MCVQGHPHGHSRNHCSITLIAITKLEQHKSKGQTYYRKKKMVFILRVHNYINKFTLARQYNIQFQILSTKSDQYKCKARNKTKKHLYLIERT